MLIMVIRMELLDLDVDQAQVFHHMDQAIHHQAQVRVFRHSALVQVDHSVHHLDHLVQAHHPMPFQFLHLVVQ